MGGIVGGFVAYPIGNVVGAVVMGLITGAVYDSHRKNKFVHYVPTNMNEYDPMKLVRIFTKDSRGLVEHSANEDLYKSRKIS